MTAIDRNGDGRVDLLSVAFDKYNDIKIDRDFDGKWDSWIIYGLGLFVQTELSKGKPGEANLRLAIDVSEVRLRAPRVAAKVKFTVAPARAYRSSFGTEVTAGSKGPSCDDSSKRDDGANIQYQATIGTDADWLDRSCLVSTARKLAATRVLNEVRNVFANSGDSNECVREVLAGSSIPAESLDLLRGEVMRSPESLLPIIHCEVSRDVKPVAQASYSPPKIIFMFDEKDELLCQRDEARVARHEVGHLIASRACIVQGSSASVCDTGVNGGDERFAEVFESGLTSCLAKGLGRFKMEMLPKEYESRKVPPSALSQRSASEQIAVSTGISDVAIVPMGAPAPAAMHELAFVKPSPDWVPTPNRVATVTRELAKPVIEYAERVRSAVLPAVQRELSVLPQADATERRERRAARREVSGDINKSVVKKAATGTRDEEVPEFRAGRGPGVQVATGQGNSKLTAPPAKDPLAADIGKISESVRAGENNVNRREQGSDGVDSRPRRLEGGKGTVATAAGVKAPKARGGSGGGAVVAASSGSSDSDEESSQGNGMTAASGSREPAAVSPRALVDSLANRDVNSVNARTLAKQLAEEKAMPRQPLNDALKARGIAIVDTVGNRYGRDYKEAPLRYVIRGERLTDMSPDMGDK